MLGLRNLFLAVICVIMGKNYRFLLSKRTQRMRFF